MPQPVDILRKYSIPSPTLDDQLFGVGDVNLPTSPVSPQRDLPAQLRVPGIPSDSAIRDIEANTINPSAHWTTPAEESGWGQTSRMAGTDSVLEGLRSAQPQPAPPPPLPMRNQAMVEMYAKKMGLGPEATSGAISERDLQQAEQEFSRHQDEIERLHAMAPMETERLRGANALATEAARIKGQQSLENTGFEQLQQLMSGGKIDPGTMVSTPKGFSFRTANPNQMLPMGVGGSAQKELIRLRNLRDNLPMPGSLGAAGRDLGKLFNGVSLAQQRASYDQQIAALEQ